MSDHEMNGDDHLELSEEEQADLDAEIEEGYAEIETQSVTGVSWVTGDSADRVVDTPSTPPRVLRMSS